MKKLITVRRKARREWHRTRLPEDKNKFNNISNKLNRIIKNIDEKRFTNYVENMSADKDTNYSLWRVTKKYKRPIARISPIKNDTGDWMRKDEEKVEVFAKHLQNVFRPQDIESEIDLVKHHRPNIIMKRITPLEIARVIDTNLNPKKAPGIDEIFPLILKELSKKSVILLTYLFNAYLRLEYVPECFKTAEIIMIPKPGKPPEEITSYRPISLLPVLAKLWEKIYIRRLKPLVNLPEYQFGFRDHHSTTDQVQSN